MVLDWYALLLGFTLGVGVSVVFFTGLNWGMRVALSSSKPATVLLFSATCRIAALLWVGYAVTAAVGSGWAAVGYAAGFFLVRLAAILWVRPTTKPATTPTLS